MQLVVIRHAIAMEREEFAPTGRDDALRPLTARGEAKMKKAAAGLREVVPSIDVLAASPFTRAQQTAAIVGDAYDGLQVETTASLEPDSAMDDFIEWLRAQRGETVAVVARDLAHGGDRGIARPTEEGSGVSARVPGEAGAWHRSTALGAHGVAARAHGGWLARLLHATPRCSRGRRRSSSCSARSR
jgi:phosphohistidine phosphatase SixA